MTISEMLLPEFDQEMASTRRILDRVPEDKFTWKPHAKSMTLGRLATHISEIPAWAARALTVSEFDMAPPGGPALQPRALGSTAEILALFDKNVVEGRRALAAVQDAEFERPWSFKRAGQIIWTRPKHDVFRRMAMSHIVHHRAQLGVYLRLQEVAIPGVYGPSADELPPRR